MNDMHWIARVSFAILAVLCLCGSVSAQSLPMNIPNLCAATTITATASGAWSSASTWTPARVPNATDVVNVAAGKTVTYSTVSDVKVPCIAVNGILRWSTTVDTRLRVTNLMVMPTGYLEIGTTATPVLATKTAEIFINDVPLNTATDPEQYGTAFLAFGMVRINGAPKLTFTRLAVEPLAGATTLTLSEAPTGWRPGDKLAIPGTRQLSWTNTIWEPRQWEELTVASTSGNVVTLTTPLAYNHRGSHNMDGALEDVPHVMNLTRNVTFKSENPAGTRGHFLATHRADVDIRYAGFVGMGRTTIQPLDSASGSHIGTNQIGRYPIHMHHLAGPVTPQSNGRQFTIIGCAIDEVPKWALSIHASHFGLIQDCVGYNSNGAVFVTEDGSETGNIFNHNFGLRSWGIDGREAMGREGTIFWFRGVDNIITNNVAANAYGDQFDAAYGYKMFEKGTGNVRRPKFQGADPDDDAQVDIVSAYTIPIRQFENNEAYGEMESGLTFWWIGFDGNGPVPNMPESVIKNFKVWNVFNRGIYHYEANHVTVDGLVMRGSWSEAGLNGLCCQSGVDFGDYYGKDITYKNFNIQGRVAGFVGSILTDGTTVKIQDGYLRNQMNFVVSTMNNISYSAEILRPRHYEIRNVRMVLTNEVDRFQPIGNITLGYSEQAPPSRGLTLLDDIKVYDYQGVVGDNFQVFYTQQAPSYVVPQSQFNGDGTRYLIGAPAAGLTNQQAWAQFGVAIGGAVAPCSMTRSDTWGAFVCPMNQPGPTPPAAPGKVIVTQN